jgi:hypothetical protein
MYFFDIYDYYSNYTQTTWNNAGYSTAAGCALSYKPTDFQDLFGTARATRDAFIKAITEWYLVVSQSGFTQTIDNGCSPSYADLFDDVNQKYIGYQISFKELTSTVILHRYYYETTLQLSPNAPVFSLGNTYEDYLHYYLDGNNDWYTGSTNSTIRVYNPYTLTMEDVTVTYNYGTSFEHSDLVSKVNNYETDIKAFMCSVKNLMSGIDGDTFDELVVDENGDFVPNSGTTYSFI